MHSITTGQLKEANNIFSKALSIVHRDTIFFSALWHILMMSTEEKLAVIIWEILYHADKSDIQFKKEMYPTQDKEQEIHDGPTPKTKQKFPA